MKKIIMALSVLGLMAASSMAAIVMEASSSTGVNPADQSGVLSLGAFGSAGNYVVIGVTAKNRGDDGGSSPITSLTYGGVTKTAAGTAYSHWNSYTFHTTLYVFEAGSGAINLNYTMSEANAHDGLGIVAARYSGVGGFNSTLASVTSPTDNAASGFDTSITTTGTDSMIAAVFGIGNQNGALSMDDDNNGDNGTGYTTIIAGEVTSDKSTTAVFEMGAATAAEYGIFGHTTDNDRGALVGVELLVPEPATVGMLGLGSIVALLIRRIRA